MFDFRIVIITYKRADTIIEKTLNMLQRYKIPSHIIDLWVANKEEYQIYKEKVPSNLYNKIYIGEVGIANARISVRRHYPDNQLILNLDDDIEEILLLKNGKLEPVGSKLIKLTKLAYTLMKKHHAKLCGLYAVNNAFFMSNTYSTGLYYCVGAAYWTLNDSSTDLDVTLEDKEDFQRSIHQYLKYNKVIRLNNVTIKTNYYKNPGGMGETRTEDRVKNSGVYLLKKHPNLVERNTARKNHFEIKFKKQKNNEKRRFQ